MAVGQAYLADKKFSEAETNFKEALRLEPDSPSCLDALARLYATCPIAAFRNGAEAVRLAERACELTKRKNPGMLDTLAAAYAEAGRFADAVKTAKEAQARAEALYDSKTAVGERAGASEAVSGRQGISPSAMKTDRARNDLPPASRHRAVLFGFALALGTLACYWPVQHYDYVSLDDNLYVTQAPLVQAGITGPGFKWAFTSVECGNWNPLVWLSHMLDTQLFGPEAGGHHVTNVLLHLVNVLLLFHILRTMTGAMWRSALAAALFAWHPLHVESVAWISERKDVLSTLFWLLTIWA